MNPSDWTNAVKGAVIILVSALMNLIGVIIAIIGVNITVEQFALLSTAVETFVGALLGIWILFTYRQSPSRATPSTLKSRGLKP